MTSAWPGMKVSASEQNRFVSSNGSVLSPMIRLSPSRPSAAPLTRKKDQNEFPANFPPQQEAAHLRRLAAG